MPSMQLAQNVKQAAISVQVRKANGRLIDFGVVSYTHRNPLRRLRYALLRRLGRAVPEHAVFG